MEQLDILENDNFGYNKKTKALTIYDDTLCAIDAFSIYLYMETLKISFPCKSMTAMPLREMATFTLCSFFLPFAFAVFTIFLTDSVLMLSPVIFSTTVLPKNEILVK